MRVDPDQEFQGTLVVLVPHMDDGVLGCGGTLARVTDKSRIHVIYATDGAQSPRPALPWLGPAPDGLPEVRMEEARTAMARLGVHLANVHFLGLPDGRLRDHGVELSRLVSEMLQGISPAFVFTPFRYDRHPDHVALNHATIRARRDQTFELMEYFVYHQWRLLPGGDVRRHLRSGLTVEVDVGKVSSLKRAALDEFKSQTTMFFPWQTRPNLTPRLLDEVSRAPEEFLRFSDELEGADVFSGFVPWIRIAHVLEPTLKRRKDQLVEIVKWGLGRHG